MEIKSLVFGDELWLPVVKFSNQCSWQPTGAYLSKCMNDNKLSDWERVFAALENNSIIGFCALTKTTSAFSEIYTPNIGFVFVSEPCRGNRVSEKLCIFAIDYAKSIGFDKVYLYSDHANLYEKYRFSKIGELAAPWGVKQSIYMFPI